MSEAFGTLRKRKWVLIAAVVLGGSYGAYKAFTQPKIFDATSTIQVHSGAAAEYKLNAAADYSDDSQTRMNTELAILKSDTLLYTVAKEMNLANNPDFTGAPPGPPTHTSLDDPNVRAGVIGNLRGSLHVALVPRTELMTISYTSLSAKLAADIVNKVVYDYIQRSYVTPVQSTNRVAEWLSLQLNELKTKVEQSQAQMMELERKLGVLGYDNTRNQLSASLEDLLNAEGTAKIARINAESRYNMVTGMDVHTIEGSIETTPGTAPGELNSLRSQIAVLRATEQQMTKGGPEGGLGPNNPRVKAIQAEIDELTRQLTAEQNRLILQAKEAFLAAKAAESSTEHELEVKKKQAYDQGEDLVRYNILRREFDQNRTLYDGLEQRLLTARLQAGLDAAEVDVIDQALPPVSPTLQPNSSIILTNVIFFLLGGIVIAFLIESLDTSLNNVAEIEAVMQLPSLAVVPRSRRSTIEQAPGLSVAQRNMNVLNQPKSQFAEAIRSLRTSLLLATAGRPPKFILFTSATPSEGKTTTATNLACVLAQGDSRVLLIDADLRRPNVHHRFGLVGRTGLTSVLSGALPFEQVVQQVPEVPNLDVLPSGPVPPFPTEMLSSDAMRALLDYLGGIYTHIIIDSPPILSVTDGVILSRFADTVVLVIRHGKSNKHIIQRARDLLLRSGARMGGMVLNAVDLNSPDYYGYYGYSGYSYGSADADTWTTTQPPAPDGESRKGGRDL
ncbi:MAG: polysaccharide biosynthesis tyrosine autokinase [Acidobacteriota bacterium]|nr:polysaccharide biosynthesis tyrosine autokinase [Acidobacteriota bacterium]